MTSQIIPVPPFDLVIVGATGDLSLRKLLPALYYRDRDNQLSESSRIIGAARRSLNDGEFIALAREHLTKHINPSELCEVTLSRFLNRLTYRVIGAGVTEKWNALAAHLASAPDHIRVFYLAIGPEAFGATCDDLASAGLAGNGSRLVVEKPFGRNLQSALELNRQITRVFDERNIYRIDHYLGKETVQNLMALRFANALFEPMWNSQHIDHVQITVAESLGVGTRAGYYGSSGAMRDMVQNHLLQLLCLTAMEAPTIYSADEIRDEKEKVLRALMPIDGADVFRYTARGQYGSRNDQAGFLDEPGGDEHPNTETFVALRAEIGNWRWAGTPFYLRTGKCMAAQMSEIAIVFKPIPHSIFSQIGGPIESNVLSIRLQPDEGITMSVNVKDPGPGGMRFSNVPLDMSFADSLRQKYSHTPDAYERLLMDVVRGDQTLFMRQDEVVAAWSWVDPIIEGWASSGKSPDLYMPGNNGPDEALRLLHQDGRSWRSVE